MAAIEFDLDLLPDGRACALTLLLTLSVACGGDTGPSGVTVRDSAGVRIVTNAPNGGADVWARAASEPRLVVGQAEGAPERLFDRIRSVARFPDGALMVADGGSQEIRVFDLEGGLEARFGGAGEGPGEFRFLQSALVTGDSVMVYDGRSHRLSLFARSGELVGDRPLPEGLGRGMVGRLSATSLLFKNPSSLVPEGPEGLHRRPRHYVRYDLETSELDTLASLPGYEYDVVEADGRWGAYQIPYPRDAFDAVGPAGRWYAGANDRFEILVRDAEGAVHRSIRYPGAEEPLAEAEVRELEAATIEEVDPSPAGRRSIERLFREVPRPDFRPAFSRLVADRQGRLWVADWSSGFADVGGPGRTWWVFDPDGVLLGAVPLLRSFELHDAGADWLVGVDTDDVGIQRVVVLGLERSGDGG